MDIDIAVSLSILDINFPIEEFNVGNNYFGFLVNIIKDSVVIGYRCYWINSIIENLSSSIVCNLSRLAYKDSGKLFNDVDVEIVFFIYEFSKEKFENYFYIKIENDNLENISAEKLDGDNIYTFPIHIRKFNVKNMLYSNKLYMIWYNILYKRFRNTHNVSTLNALYIKNIIKDDFKEHCINTLKNTNLITRHFLELSFKVHGNTYMQHYIPFLKNYKLEYNLLLFGIKSKKIKCYTKKILSYNNLKDLFSNFEIDDFASLISYCDNFFYSKRLIKISKHLIKIFKKETDFDESDFSKLFFIFCLLSKYSDYNYIWECFILLFKKISTNAMIVNDKNEEDILSTMRLFEGLGIYLKIY